jgi:hypothetical protein
VRFHLRGLSMVFISWELIMAACILNSDDTYFRYMSLPSFSRFSRKRLFFDIHNLPHSPTTKHTQSGAIIFSYIRKTKAAYGYLV